MLSSLENTFVNDEFLPESVEEEPLLNVMQESSSAERRLEVSVMLRLLCDDSERRFPRKRLDALPSRNGMREARDAFEDSPKGRGGGGFGGGVGGEKKIRGYYNKKASCMGEDGLGHRAKELSSNPR